ncbi:MAG: hypothetical protein HF978_05780 [Desulfobacteraceae bacterium]|nr:hypothetical protein [Desulfobacteraceae bacterium]MBC2755043.1 hypothetical protein [Desulfobacteraceae bacterium]
MQFIQKYIYSLIFLVLFVLAVSISTAHAGQAASEEAVAEKPTHYIVATYFHTTARCSTCHKIEELSSQAVNLNFENELKSGKVVWRAINVDEPENKHYNKDYQLYTKSLIISEVKDGKEIQWKNLEKIWTYVRDEEKFDAYVKDEIKDWIEE